MTFADRLSACVVWGVFVWVLISGAISIAATVAAPNHLPEWFCDPAAGIGIGCEVSR